jgi:hypothetical protein
MPGGASIMAILDRISERKPVSEDKLPATPAPGTASAAASTPQAASGLRVAAILLRTTFIFILIALVIRVSQPQNETIWSAYDTPADLVRLWLGIGACIWLVWQLFEGPKDAHAYRTWLYLGLALVPFSLICLVAFW